MGKKLRIFLGVLLIASVISYFLIDANEKKFDQTEWIANPLTRYKMATDILESQLLINKTKIEVLDLLGNAKPSTLEGRDHLVFDLGTPPSFFEDKPETLVVIFENDKAVTVVKSLNN